MKFDLLVHRAVSRNPMGRDWVCGDLHGHFDVLQAALAQSGFDPRNDRLFLLGDLIDRGPQSRELLNWVLSTAYVDSVMGNHELMFIGGSTIPGYRDKHRAIGGGWADDLDFSLYRRLTTGCANEFPLTLTLECAQGTLGLVHAQTPFDDWRQVATAAYSHRLAMGCTWPRTRVQGPEHTVAGVSMVVSGHIGTPSIMSNANHVWIDTLEASGHLTLMTVDELFSWMRDEHPHD